MMIGVGPAAGEAVREVRPASLAAAVPTAMVLTDYALTGRVGTPTADIREVASRLPPELAVESRPLRAALVHGTALRDVLLASLPADHPGHVRWPALRRWMQALTGEQVLALIQYGVGVNLTFADASLALPDPAVALRQSVATDLETRLVIVLSEWGIPEPAAAAAQLVGNPDAVRALLVELLEKIWRGWLAAALHELPEPPASATQTPATGSGWVFSVTGVLLDASSAETADAADHLVVMPCPGLGRAVSTFVVDGVTYVLHTPEGSDLTGRQVAPLTAIGSLGTTLQALGDPTRLSLVLQLAGAGPLSMNDLIHVTGVHQSTVSRQVAALRRAGLVRLDTQRRVALNTAAIQHSCRTLLAVTGAAYPTRPRPPQETTPMTSARYTGQIVFCRNVPATADLYEHTLGMRRGPDADGDVSMRVDVAGGGEVEIYLHPASSPAAVALGTFTVDDVDTAVHAMTATGWTLTAPATDEPWGVRAAGLTDPDGHSITLNGPPALDPPRS